MIIDKDEFCEEIEKEYANSLPNEHSIIDVIINICEKYNIDILMIKPLLNRSITERIYNEALKLNMMKQSNKTSNLTDYL